MQWLRDLWMWLRSYPRPWRVVRITGDVLSGGTLLVEDGMTVYVQGNVQIPANNVHTIKVSKHGCLTIQGSLGS